MSGGLEACRWCCRTVGWLTALYLISSSSIGLGQPANAPPQRIKVDIAEQKLAGPTLVTLSEQDASPIAIFESLAAQTGISFDVYSAKDHLASLGNVTLDYQAQPVCRVLRELTSKLEVSLVPYEVPRFNDSHTGIVIRVKPGVDANLQGPQCETGPFSVIASRVARSLSLAPSESPPAAQRVVIEFVVLVDPKIRTRGKPDGFDLEIQDDQGQLMTVEKTEVATWTREVTSQSPLIWHLKAWATLARAETQTLRHVKGSLRFITTTSSQRWEVNDVLQAESSTKSVENATFVIRSILPYDYAGPAYAATLSSWGRGEEADFGWPPRSLYDRVGSVSLLDAAVIGCESRPTRNKRIAT